MRSSTLAWAFSLWSAVCMAAPFAAPLNDNSLPRLAIYFQTTHDSNGNPISMLPLIHKQGIALTHLLVCSFHINQGSNLTLNDAVPDDASFNTLWNETKVLQNAGVTVMGMVGGAAAGSFTTDTLDGNQTTFEHYYGQLHDVIQEKNLQGMDLDVEQSMSQSGISRLVKRLKSDFGSDFAVTLAPVATAMTEKDGTGLSGFDYDKLDAADGSDISFYNVQFYNGFGSLSNPDDYEAAVNQGFSPDRLNAGQLTNPANGGSGYVKFPALNKTVEALVSMYGQIGGVVGWEYFNSEPGGTSKPWKWAEEMTEILRPNMAPTITITGDDADLLEKAYKNSKTAPRPDSLIKVAPKMDYQAIVRD